MNEANENLVRQLERIGNVQPSPAATTRALDRVRQRLIQAAEPKPIWRRPMLWRRLAAVGSCAAAVALLVYWFHAAPVTAMAGFADVQAALQKTRSVTCRQKTETNGKVEQVIRITILGDELARSDEPNGTYSIADARNHRNIVIDPKKKEATLFQGTNLPVGKLYDRIKNLPNQAGARPLPAKKLNGKDALGFVVSLEGHDLAVWADAGTKLPVLVEAEETANGVTVKHVIDEFLFDKELDPKLFSFDIPPGYTIKKIGFPDLQPSPTDPELKSPIATPNVGVGPVKFFMKREEMEKVFGKPDGVEIVNKERGTMNVSYASRGIFLVVGKELGVVLISCVDQQAIIARVRNFSGKTDKGIALGASAADIERAYGKPDRKEMNMGSTYLTYDKLNVSFTLFSDKLVQMSFMRPPRK
jgi:outer membrane lipoprotein-sorting protein